MNRSSKSITLALIGSAFLAGGCQDEPVQETQQNQHGTPGHSSGGGVFVGPRIGGGGGFGGGIGGGSSSVGSAPSARGGFGATGTTGAGS